MDTQSHVMIKPAFRPTIHRAVAGLLLVTCGCSFARVRPAPSPPVDASAELACTESRGPPFGDIAIGTAALAGTVGLFAVAAGCKPHSPDDYSCLATGFGALLGAIGLGTLVVVEGASAVYGFRQTARCSELRAMQRACSQGDPAACGQLAAPDGARRELDEALRAARPKQIQTDLSRP